MPKPSDSPKNRSADTHWNGVPSTAIKSFVGQALDMPRELILNLPHLSIVGNEDIIVQNHQGLLAYASDLVRIKTTSGILNIAGRQLMINKITNEYIRLTGRLTSISYTT